MDVNEELSAQYKGKRYRRPSDNRIITVSHILQFESNGQTYYEGFFNVEDPEPETPGAGKCPLESLQALREIK